MYSVIMNGISHTGNIWLVGAKVLQDLNKIYRHYPLGRAQG